MKIRVYSKPNCGACDITKGWLAQHDIEFEAIDAYEDEQAMADLQMHGFMSFPVVTVDGWNRAWTDFDINKLEELK